MRILFLSVRQCWPPVSGAKLREYHLARALGRDAEVTHVFHREHGLPVPTAADLPFCRDFVPLAPVRPYTAVKIVRGLLGRWPLPVVNYTSAEMKSTLAGLRLREQFDLVHLDSIHMASYAAMIRKATAAPIVYDWHNIESEAMRRYSTNARLPLHKLYAAVTASRLAALEKRILRESFGHIVCSRRECEDLRRIVPEARIAVIENGVDIRSFSGESSRPERRNRLVFVGSMSYHANIDAAIWFTHAVWPGIRGRFPGWRLTLVGSNPAPAVMALRREEGVEVTGTVADVRPYYHDAVAAVVPLRTGGGTRLKILEAMAAGVPVVSTTLGAEGLAVTPGADILIADRQEDWLTQLAAISSQGSAWEALSKAGRELVRQRYDWEVLGRTLFETYSRWLDIRRMESSCVESPGM